MRDREEVVVVEREIREDSLRLFDNYFPSVLLSRLSTRVASTVILPTGRATCSWERTLS